MLDSSSLPLALVIDDDDKNRQIFSVALKKLGFETIEAENGKVGLERLQTNPITVIFLDYAMPYMNGFEFLRAQKFTTKKDIPVIMISTSTSHNIMAVEQYAARHWIHKPPLPHELEETLIMMGLI
ncbi:MAG: response regulator [Alphaproteobacteria bacterium]|nr:response regulator [Alphaproteobacteria bacterium]